MNRLIRFRHRLRLRPLVLSVAWLTLGLGPISMAEDGPGFDADVAPILARRCLDCHSGLAPKGKLDLTRRVSTFKGGEDGPSVVPGKPEESPLWERVEADEMPPKTPLSNAEKATIRAWVASGADWGTDPIDPYQVTTSKRAGRDWWSLRPVVRPTIPPVKREGWPRNPVDAFVLARLEASGLAPSPEADRRGLIRRLSFDLVGLPPSPEEVEAFVTDPAPEAYERAVDRLLGSPQYGVRWARWWLDLARYGESNGFEFDEYRANAWRYRDWVVDAFNRDLPYEEFARLQVAGDVIRPEDPGAVEATGFLVAGAYDTVGQGQISPVMRAVVRADELEDLVGTVAQSFLGLTVHCARCHDHKFDPIRQVEYFRIASSLSGVRHGERDLSTIDPDLIALGHQVEEAVAKVAAIETPTRDRLRLARQAKPVPPPAPMASWDFDKGLDDRVGSLKAMLQGGAKLTPQGLRLDGKTGYASTLPLPRTLKAKTLEAWVKLDDLGHQGAGIIGIQTPEGRSFDTIVFAEQQSGRWIAGSDFFRRTRPVLGDLEVEATSRPVHVATTYAEDGTIQLYRDGVPYGESYPSSGPFRFDEGEAQVVFGLRHAPVGGNRMLAGTILRARVYDRALQPAEVAASAAMGSDSVPLAEVVAALPLELRVERSRLLVEVARLRGLKADQTHKAYAVAPRSAGTTNLQIRGNPAEPGDVVTPGGVSAISGLVADFGLPADAPEADRRRKLASWITSRENPLFARVAVNRLWQAHFGSGLVEMPSDFGFNGGLPSHPELLDWLSSELAHQGGSLKRMHRLIVTSATYRQSSRPDALAMARDAGDRLLWRKAPTRLEAEMVRDAMYSVSGRLDLKLGGPSFFDHAIDKGLSTASFLYKAVPPETPGLNRRTLFRAWARGGRSPILDAFDCPDPSTTAPRRAVTTTPLQALSLMNNALVFHLADAFATRLAREAGPDPARQAALAYALAYGRLPDPDERLKAAKVVEQFGAATLARAIFNSGEFVYVN